MARPFFQILILLAAGLSGAAAGGSGRNLFAYETDSLRATVTRLGGAGPDGPDSLTTAGWFAACAPAQDSLRAVNLPGPGASAWYEIALADKRSGKDLRFPVAAAVLRDGLRKACRERGGSDPERIAAGLRDLATALKVRMAGPGNGAAE